MKTNLIILAALLFAISSYPQQNDFGQFRSMLNHLTNRKEVSFDLIPYRKGNKWGFCDRNKKIVIECKYKRVGLFIADITYAVLGNKYGYIDKKGRVVVPFKYDYAFQFSDNLALVFDEKSNKYGYIDVDGKEKIPLKFSVLVNDMKLYCFSEGLAVFKQGDIDLYGYINKDGEIVIPAQFQEAYPFSEGFAYVVQNGKSHFIDKTGKIVIYDIKGTPESFKSFSDGLALIRNVHEDKEFFIDYKGNIRIDLSDRYPNYKVLFSSFYNGVAVMLLVKKDEFGGYVNFIDKEGKVIVKTKFWSTSPFFSNGYALIKVPSSNEEHPFEYGLINTKGEIIIKPGKYIMEYVGDNLFIIETYDGDLGYMDINGNRYWED